MSTANGTLRKLANYTKYLYSSERHPLFLAGDSLEKLRTFPAESIDFAMTSPPYWGQRAYAGGRARRSSHPPAAVAQCQ